MPASSISIGRESAEIEFHGKGEIKSERSSKDYLRPGVCRFEIIRIKGGGRGESIFGRWNERIEFLESRTIEFFHR